MIRKRFNDWDFSELGRERQAKRMKENAIKSNKQWVVLDFIAQKRNLEN